MGGKIRVLLLLPLLFIMASCTVTLQGAGGSSGIDGGVYKSTNRGDTWVQRALVPNLSGVPKSIGSLDVQQLIMDPLDSKTLYMGTVDNGLFFTYDGADSWQMARTFNHGTVRAVAVDPADKCTIYIAAENKVYKSTDCARSWQSAYFDNDLTVTINAISVATGNTSQIYFGNSRGDIMKSNDGGGTWFTLTRLDNNIVRIITRPQNSNIIFAATQDNGLFRSTDAGSTWTDLKESLKDYNDGSSFRDITVSISDPGTVFLATRYGLLKTINNGDDWRKIELLTPEKEATINSIAIGPKDNNEIYYTTNTTFYRSLDGGKTWTSKKLPTSRSGWKLVIDFDHPEVIYLGAKNVK